MRHYFLLLLSFIVLTACDAPQRTRLQQVGGYSSSNYSGSCTTQAYLSTCSNYTASYNSCALNPSQSFCQGFCNNYPTTPACATSTTGGSTGSSTGSTLPAGFTNCTFSNQGYSAGLGYIGVCQSTVDETQVAMKPGLTDTVTRTCLIPTYKDANGSSSYIGQPQCTYTTQNTVVQGQLLKNRSGFANYTLNGLMIMKESSLTAYFNCMDAYIKYVSAACPYGAQTNATCDQYARNYMAQLCTTFKSQHSYIDLRLK